jgi:RNA polymerase II elongation factor ELL
MSKRPPTSQPGSNHTAVLSALRVPLIHLLAVTPSKDILLAGTCRTSLANVRELLPKIAKRSSDDSEKWQLTDKSFRELNPYQFTYKSAEDREQAINGAIKSFDRLRLAKDDKLWQILLPREERGQGKCLSRLTVKAHEAKPSTPLHKITKMNDKKPVKKAEEKDADKDAKKTKEVKTKEVKAKDAPRPKKVVKEKVVKDKIVRDEAKLAAATGTATNSTPTLKAKSVAPSAQNTPVVEASKVRTKKEAPIGEGSLASRVKPKMPATSRDIAQRERAYRVSKPPMSVNTKPKNPSPLSASPPVNASDFEDNHPVHKALSAAPSPAKGSSASGNSDRSLKRKANDIDSDIHNHSLSVKAPRLDRATPNHTPRTNGTTPSSTNSLKRKSAESSTSNTPTTKVRKVTSIDTGLASSYPTHSSQISPGDSSSATTSPSLPSLSFRQTVVLSQKFQKYYKKYEELYWQLTEATTAPTESQRGDLLKMHKKLEEMKREIKAGAGVHR